MARTEAPAAMTRLSPMLSQKGPWASIFRYQPSDTPSGGKRRIADGLNDRSTTNTTADRMKA